MLQVKKVDEEEKTQKKASLVKASDTVQGFVNFYTFCEDIVRMLGDGILLVKPNIYCLIVQLIFEAVSFVHKLKSGEDVICLRRITDIVNPFENGITESLPVKEIYLLKNL